MVPGFRFERATARFTAFAAEEAEQPFFHGDDGEQHDEGKRRRDFVRGNDVDDAFVGDDARRGEEKGDGDEGGQ